MSANKIDILDKIIGLIKVNDYNYIIELELLNFQRKNLKINEKQLNFLRTLVYGFHNKIYVVFNDDSFCWASKNNKDYLEKTFNCFYNFVDLVKNEVKIIDPRENELKEKEDEFIKNFNCPNFKTKSMDYQKRISILASSKNKYGLFLEPGLGKSKISLDISKILLNSKKIEKVIIYSPASLMTNWNMEIRKHCYAIDSKKMIVVSHSELSLIQKKEKSNLKYNEEISILKKQKDKNSLKKIKQLEEKIKKNSNIIFLKYLDDIQSGKALLIIDEFHHFKNSETIRTKFLLDSLTENSRLLMLTGTPNPKGIIDLFVYAKIFNLIDGMNYYQFMNKYLNVEKTQYGWKTIGEKKEQVREILFQFKIYSSWVKKEDVLELPEKNYLTYYYSLNKEQEQIIKKFIQLQDQEKKDEIKLTTTFGFEEKSIERCLMRILQIQNGFIIDENKEIIEIKENNKLNLLIEIIEEIGNKPIIIFCTFTAEVDFISKKLSDIGIKNVARHGKMNKKAEDPINKFINQEVNVLIATTASTGTGFTMVHCNNIIYYSNDFNSINRIQSEDRIHRIGQEKTCNYYDLIAENTLDDIIYKSLKKRNMKIEEIFKKIKK